MGCRGASPAPRLLPGVPALGRGDERGAAGPPRLFTLCSASLWRGRDGELTGLSAQRGRDQRPVLMCLRVPTLGRTHVETTRTLG